MHKNYFKRHQQKEKWISDLRENYYKAASNPVLFWQSLIPASAEPLLRLSFERIGRLKCKDGLNLQTSKVGWFALVGSTLHAYLENSQGEEIHLRKLNELCEWDADKNVEFLLHMKQNNSSLWNNMIPYVLCSTAIQQDNEVLVLVEKGRWDGRTKNSTHFKQCYNLCFFKYNPYFETFLLSYYFFSPAPQLSLFSLVNCLLCPPCPPLLSKDSVHWGREEARFRWLERSHPGGGGEWRRHTEPAAAHRDRHTDHSAQLHWLHHTMRWEKRRQWHNWKNIWRVTVRDYTQALTHLYTWITRACLKNANLCYTRPITHEHFYTPHIVVYDFHLSHRCWVHGLGTFCACVCVLMWL